MLEDDGVDRGLMFAGIGAHLDRRFEFMPTGLRALPWLAELDT